MNHNKGLVNDPRPRAEHPNSGHWDKIRKEALDRDQHKCQTCYSESDLEVHHRTYKRFGKEILEDLITLCKDCHEAITNSVRGRRYAQMGSIKPQEYNRSTYIEINIETYELPKIEPENYRNRAPYNAQRATGRSTE